MSHFSVLVIGESPEYQLAPFHEFECTGKDDEFVQDVDITDQLREEFESDTTTRYIDPDGVKHDPYDVRFYRDPTKEEKAKIGPLFGSGGGQGISWSSRDWKDGLGYRAKVHFRPEGWQEVEVPTRELESFAAFVEGQTGSAAVHVGLQLDLAKTHKYSYAIIDDKGDILKVIDRTNPNKRWDWWVIGGRWSNHFLLKTGQRACQARKGDISWQGMIDTHMVEESLRYQTFHELLAGREYPKWETFRDQYASIEEARKAYRLNPVVREVRAAFGPLFNSDELNVPKDQFDVIQRFKAISTHAIVRDRQWHQHADMGWFGVKHNPKSFEEWQEEFTAILDECPDDALMTIVDCHI